MRPHFKYTIAETGHSACYKGQGVCTMVARRVLLTQVQKGRIFGKPEADIYRVDENGREQLVDTITLKNTYHR